MNLVMNFLSLCVMLENKPRQISKPMKFDDLLPQASSGSVSNCDETTDDDFKKTIDLFG